MTCKRIQTQLADYSAQRLAPSETSEIRRHLDRCGVCALFLQEEAALARGLERLPSVEPSADLWRRVSAGLDAPESQRASSRFFGWTWGKRPLAALVTSLAATAGLVAYVQFGVPTAPVKTPVAVNTPITITLPSREVNPTVDDPMADQMDNLFAAMDQMTREPVTQ